MKALKPDLVEVHFLLKTINPSTKMYNAKNEQIDAFR